MDLNAFSNHNPNNPPLLLALRYNPREGRGGGALLDIPTWGFPLIPFGPRYDGKRLSRSGASDVAGSAASQVRRAPPQPTCYILQIARGVMKYSQG